MGGLPVLMGVGNYLALPHPEPRHLATKCNHGCCSMSLFADLLSTLFEPRYRREITEAVMDDRPLIEMAQALIGSAGETSGLALARDILARFTELDDVNKVAFFQDVAKTMNIDPEAVHSALDEYERSSCFIRSSSIGGTCCASLD